MNKKILLACAAVSLMLGSCKNNDLADQVTKEITPQVTANINVAPLTRAGVVEENDNFHEGENFFWHSADEVDVWFGSDKLTYKVPEDHTPFSNVAQLTTSGTVAAGTYDIKSYFPSNFSESVYLYVPEDQIQTDKTSSHLGQYMYMRAVSKEVEVSENSSVNLNFKHLSSVFRVLVWNAEEIPNLTLKGITLRVSSGAKAFTRLTQLGANPDSEDLTIFEKTDYMSLKLDDGSFDSETNYCHAYMAALPTEAFLSTDKLVVSMYLTDGTQDYLCKKELSFAVATEAGFLQEGIKKGHSYYLKLKLPSESSLQKIKMYEEGDFFPDPTDRNTAKGIVYKADPGSFGMHGKVVSAIYTPKLLLFTWLGYEETSETDGRQTMIAIQEVYNWQNSFPAVKWIHDNMNSSVLIKNGGNGWYIPSIREVIEFYSYISGVRSHYDGTLSNSNVQSFIDRYPDSKTKRDAFNQRFEMIPNGQKLTNSGSFYASTIGGAERNHLYDCDLDLELYWSVASSAKDFRAIRSF